MMTGRDQSVILLHCDEVLWFNFIQNPFISYVWQSPCRLVVRQTWTDFKKAVQQAPCCFLHSKINAIVLWIALHLKSHSAAPVPTELCITKDTWTQTFLNTCLSLLTSCSSSTSLVLVLKSASPEEELRLRPGLSVSSLNSCKCSSSRRRSSISCAQRKPRWTTNCIMRMQYFVRGRRVKARTKSER